MHSECRVLPVTVMGSEGLIVTARILPALSRRLATVPRVYNLRFQNKETFSLQCSLRMEPRDLSTFMVAKVRRYLCFSLRIQLQVDQCSQSSRSQNLSSANQVWIIAIIAWCNNRNNPQFSVLKPYYCFDYCGLLLLLDGLLLGLLHGLLLFTFDYSDY